MSETESPKTPRINIGGTGYLLPTLDSMDMDEAMTLYRYSDLTFDQIFELEGLHPGVIAGLLHVAIQRSDPALREREIKQMVKDVNMMDIMEQFAAIAADAPDPTQDEAPKSDDDSRKSSGEAIESSGVASSEPSEPSPEQPSPEPSGGPTSVTSADSVQTTSDVSLRIS